MYQVSVPLKIQTIDRSDRKRLIQELRELDCTRVILASGFYETDPGKREALFRKYREEAAFFHQEGFEVGAWIWAFMMPGDHTYDHMVLTGGQRDPNMNCPLDERFVSFAASYIQGLATTGVDLVLYDDDYRFGWLGDKTLGCFCEHHRRAMEAILGKKVPDDLDPYMISGGPNEYRTAWVKAKGDSLRSFAAKMREAVDTVAPHVRIGICACMSTWDLDGVTAAELSRILAGKTKPYLRLIGAPYWAGGHHFGKTRLQDVIEYSRLERTWCGSGLEIAVEGDVYPRPRFQCPAAYMEGLDTATRAAGIADGIQKYAMDYCSAAGYESGYVARHVRNKPVYQTIDALFSGRTPVGLRIYEPLHQYETSEIPPELSTPHGVQKEFFKTSCKLFSSLGIPTVFEGSGTAGAVFGEAARHVERTAADQGLILDAKAARILKERGIDTGLRSYGETFRVTEERYLETDEYVALWNAKARMITVDPKAVVVSTYPDRRDALVEIAASHTEGIASYRYENAAGQRFYVLGFDAEYADPSLWRQYTKGKALAGAVEWLSGKKLPAFLPDAPDVYLLTKETNGRLSVGIWNFSEDDVLSPVVELGKEYRSIRVFGNEGTLLKNAVKLGRIEPFGFCFMELSEDGNAF